MFRTNGSLMSDRKLLPLTLNVIYRTMLVYFSFIGIFVESHTGNRLPLFYYKGI